MVNVSGISLEFCKLAKSANELVTTYKIGYKDIVMNIDIPFKIMHVCQESCDLLLAMAKKGNPNSISDVGVGMYCIHAAVHGAYLNVRINSKELKDKKIVKKVDIECKKIIEKINSKLIDIQSLVDKKL